MALCIHLVEAVGIDPGDKPERTEKGVARESHPRLVLLIARVTYCAVVAGAAGATAATGA